MNEKRILLAPMKLSQIYLVSTFLLFLFGPLNWDINNYPELIIYVSVYYSSLYFGYHYQTRKFISVKREQVEKDQFCNKTRNVFILSCVFTIVYSFMFKYSSTGSFEIDPNVFTNLGSSYFEKLDFAKESKDTVAFLPMQICTIFYVLTYFYIPISVLYYEHYSNILKATLFMTVAIHAFTWLAMGTNKGLGDILIYFVFSYFYKFVAVSPHDINKRILRVFIICLIPAIIFISIFAYSQQQRSKVGGFTAESVYTNTMLYRYSKYDEDNILLTSFGDVGKMIILNSYSYVAMGYYGFAKCLELPFEWTGGIGNSRALMSYAEQYFGLDVKDKNYLMKNERATGYPAGMYWSTVFPWLASDLTFPGVALFFIFVGAFFCKVWKRFLLYNDYISIVMLCQITMFIIYIPANNQLFQSRMSLFGSISILALYYFSKRKAALAFRR